MPAGEIPCIRPNPLTLDKAPGGTINLNWAPSCLASDNDFEIYEGLIGVYYSHGLRFCTTGGALAFNLLPANPSSYYLVVPRNDSREGSYGRDSTGVPRPQGAPACLPQLVGPCP